MLLGDEADSAGPPVLSPSSLSNHPKQWPKTITIVYFTHESAV